MALYRITESWNEDTITWENQPGYFNEALDLKILNNEQSSDFIYWQISELIKQWQKGSIANHGIVLMDIDENTDDGEIEFFSSDWTTASQRPKLMIDYYVPK